MRARVRRVHDGLHGWVWVWSTKPFALGGWGWSRDPGQAADRARQFIASRGATS